MSTRKPPESPRGKSAAAEPEALERQTARTAWTRLKIAVAVAMFAGMAMSPNLWLTERDFPFAPVVSSLPPLPAPVDMVAYGALLGALAATAAAAVPGRWIALFLSVFALLAVSDQMRWQPWAYQYLLMLVALGLYSRAESFARALNVCRLVVVCTYLWSGLQKLNSDFAEAVFPVLMQPLAGRWPAVAPLLPSAGWGVGVLEALFGIALLLPRTRKAAMAAVIAMHGLILAGLGPWGSNFNSVVWPWNLAMIAFVLILFGGAQAPVRDIVWPQKAFWGRVVLVLVGLMPALSLFNLWDAYLSFALYSGVPNIEYVSVSDAVALRLPETVRRHVYRTGTPDVNQLRTPEWSYTALNVPVNPEPRVYRAIGRYLCAFEQTPGEVQLFVYRRHRLRPGQARLDYGCEDLRR